MAISVSPLEDECLVWISKFIAVEDTFFIQLGVNEAERHDFRAVKPETKRKCQVIIIWFLLGQLLWYLLK